MRIVLELLNGPEKGRKIRLKANQTITVGRTEWSDFVIAGDQRLSSKHFSLETTRQDCQLRDLGSANGTLLNGAPSGQATLKNGDKITAGESQFWVQIEADAAPLGASASKSAELTSPLLTSPASTSPSTRLCDPPPGAPLCAPAEPLLRPAAPLLTPAPASLSAAEIRVAVTRTGLYHARCLSVQLPPLELVQRLVRKYPPHLIVDFGRLGQPLPKALDQVHTLFDWLLEPAAAASPVVISPCDMATTQTLLESGWGLDAIVCLFSSQSPQRLVSHLRAQARGPRGSVLGYCWPSVLGPLLANFRQDRAVQLIEGIDLVLLEDPEANDEWQMFSFQNLQSEFEKIGLRTGPVESPSGG